MRGGAARGRRLLVVLLLLLRAARAPSGRMHMGSGRLLNLLLRPGKQQEQAPATTAKKLSKKKKEIFNQHKGSEVTMKFKENP